jgi:glycosyltransferase involved in cell wall biosynthesis
MRILLAVHNAYTDHTSGAALTMRILMRWMAQDGHDTRVLATARFDARPPASLQQHLAEHGVSPRRVPPPKAFLTSLTRRTANLGPGRPTLEFTIDGVPVTMLLTSAPRNTPADQFEGEQFLFLLDQALREFGPGLVVTYGGLHVVQEAMRRARAAGATTVFALHNFGYEETDRFTHADHVTSCSPFLARYYRQRIGLRSTPLEPALEWDDVEAPESMRRFVTFVNPSPHKGSMLFARLADMLGSQRPDIPILVVQSASGAGALNAIPGLDFGKYPQIMASPATPRPSDFFALTRILLVPSVFEEPFGRVAAEALINGIPPLVSNRGALPETVGEGGVVLPLPEWLTSDSLDLPSRDEAKPWLDAVCGLWDDPARYERASEAARATARQRYHEAVMRKRYRSYFESLGPGGDLFG